VGALDTKGEENAFIRDVLNARGVSTLVIDTSVLGEPLFDADIKREEVAASAGKDHARLVADADRGAAVTVMAAGARSTIDRLHREGRIDGALALGGTGGTAVAAEAFRVLPLGFPKIIVSTTASGNTEIYVRETDLVLFPSVTDVAGLNRISIPILANAANAMAGMVMAPPLPERANERPLIAASMFGVTTPAVTRAREALVNLGYEVLVFHMTGTGGRTLESLVDQGLIAGVLDVTTTELADNLVGGIFDAGPDRVTAAGRNGVPQVVSVGALDMVNFGPPETVPAQFADRQFYQHNPTTTLMRTTVAESAELGSRLAAKLAAATGPTAIILPLGGISALAAPGAPFHDAEADHALFTALREGLRGSRVQIIECAGSINDPDVVDPMVALLDKFVRAAAPH
jgi:uncharacterized protein (UPF0261 family)